MMNVNDATGQVKGVLSDTTRSFLFDSMAGYGKFRRSMWTFCLGACQHYAAADWSVKPFDHNDHTSGSLWSQKSAFFPQNNWLVKMSISSAVSLCPRVEGPTLTVCFYFIVPKQILNRRTMKILVASKYQHKSCKSSTVVCSELLLTVNIHFTAWSFFSCMERPAQVTPASRDKLENSKWFLLPLTGVTNERKVYITGTPRFRSWFHSTRSDHALCWPFANLILCLSNTVSLYLDSSRFDCVPTLFQSILPSRTKFKQWSHGRVKLAAVGLTRRTRGWDDI